MIMMNLNTMMIITSSEKLHDSSLSRLPEQTREVKHAGLRIMKMMMMMMMLMIVITVLSDTQYEGGNKKGVGMIALLSVPLFLRLYLWQFFCDSICDSFYDRICDSFVTVFAGVSLSYDSTAICDDTIYVSVAQSTCSDDDCHTSLLQWRTCCLVNNTFHPLIQILQFWNPIYWV